jgi:chromosome segregation ATPase
MCKVLENRSQQDEERMDQLTNQLKEARLLAEDADGKSDEVSRKLAFVEDELEVAEDRVKSGEAKIMELEEELKVDFILPASITSSIFIVPLSRS